MKIDFEMRCETLSRKIFQCGRFDDPLNVLANADQWCFNELDPNVFSEEFRCKTWAVLKRLQLQYLDSVNDREYLYQLSCELENKVLQTKSMDDLKFIMNRLFDIAEELDLSGYPTINYKQTNDLRRRRRY